jgi:hypothetical protein
MIGGSTGTSSGALLAAPSRSLQAAEISVFWKGSVNGAGTLTQNPAIFAMYHNSANTSPFISYGLYRRSTGAAVLSTLYNNGSAQTLDFATGIDTSRYGTPMTAAMTRRSGATRLFSNGRMVASDTVSGSITYGATCRIQVNSHVTTTTNYADTSSEVAFVWNRAVSDEEIRAVHANPYLLFSPVRAVSYFVPAGPISGTSALIAPAATLTASGTIVNAYTGTSAVTAAAATMAATGTVVNPATNTGRLMLLGIG